MLRFRALPLHPVLPALICLLCAAFGPLRAQEKRLGFAQLTDAHIFDDGWKQPTPDALREAASDRTALEWAITQINQAISSGTRIDFIVYTGDLGLQNVDFPAASACHALPLDVEPGLPASTLAWAVNDLATELDRLTVRRVFFVPGNNDIENENVTDVRFGCFMAALGNRVRSLSHPLEIEALTADRAIAINGFRIAGLNSASFKNSTNYRLACSHAPSDPAGAQILAQACPEPQMAALNRLTAADSDAPLVLFMHVPDVIDPYFHRQHPDQHKSAWDLAPETRSAWERAACSPNVIGLFAGHFHDFSRSVYGTSPAASGLAYTPCVAQKTWIAPPLALKNQEHASPNARGFLTASIDGGSVAVLAHWFDDPPIAAASAPGPMRGFWIALLGLLTGGAIVTLIVFLLRKKPTNIEPQVWTPISWEKGKEMECLTELRTRAEKESLDAIAWYYRKKQSKNFWSRWLRYWAITFTILAGLVPIIAALGLIHFSPDPGAQKLAELRFEQFGYVFIGLAAGCLAYDRFFGFSTNWMRYIGAAMRIETARIRFRFEWEHLTAPLKGTQPTDDRLREMLEAIQKFNLAIREAVEQETGAWIAEFQTNLSQLDKDTKALFESAHKEKQAIEQKRRDEAHRTASIEVKIANFKDLEGGWSLSVDNAPRDADVRRESLLLKQFQAGHYQISASGHLADGKPVEASESIEVKAGKLCKLALTLQ